MKQPDMDWIYLDNNATTRIDPRVAWKIYQRDSAGYGNPASQHQPGRQARRVLETSRERVANLLGCCTAGTVADRVIFTSGGTEANNLALFGLAGDPPGRILISAVEHPSVSGAANRLRQMGFDIQIIPVDSAGVVRLDALHAQLATPTRLVSVMLGNNETGVLQPVAEIAAMCRGRGARMHSDAVQAVGKIPVDFQQLQVDSLSLSGHKFHGPHGIGALLVRSAVPLRPIFYGGFQQQGFRPGTESVPLAAGLEAALELWQAESLQRFERLTRQRERLEQTLCQALPGAVVHGASAFRLPHTTSISFPGLDRQSLVMALDLQGVACSAGSACASGSSEPSPVLLAMGIHDSLAGGAIRLSLGADTSDADLDQAIGRICNVIKDLQRRKGI